MATLKDQLLGALVGLSRASESKEISESAGEALVDGLILAQILGTTSELNSVHTDTTAGSSKSSSENLKVSSNLAEQDNILTMIDRLHEEKNKMAPDCAACQYPCGRTFDYEMEEVYSASESLREAKLLLFRLLGQIAVCSSASANQETRQFLSDALFQISCTYTAEQLAEPLKKAEDILQNNR